MASSSEAKFACESCGTRYKLTENMLGRSIKCKCGHMMSVPATMPGLGSELDEDHMAPEALEESDDDADHATALRPDNRATASGNPLSAENWKWWYFLVVGVLIGAFGAYEIYDLKIGKAIGSFLTAALCIAVGLFSRPKHGSTT